MLISVQWDKKPSIIPQEILDVTEEPKTIGYVRYKHDVKIIKKKKTRFFKEKEIPFIRSMLIISDKDYTVEVKSTYFAERFPGMFSKSSLERTFTYKKGNNEQVFPLFYHNEKGRIFYDFIFNNERFLLTFDDNLEHLKITKSNQMVAERKIAPNEEYEYHVDRNFSDDFWLWFSVFEHLSFHYES